MKNQGKPTLKLISPIPPSVNHYLKPRGFVIYQGKKPIAQISMYETAEAKSYKKQFTQYVIEEVQKQNWNWTPNKTQHFYVDCDFFFDRVDKDPNNYFKCMLDAITETQLVWLDDNVACERVNSIRYDSINPRIELTIYPVDYIGIYKDMETLNKFKEEYCNKCSKSNKNCTVFNKSLEGRVQEEIVDLRCSKFKVIKEGK